MALKEFIQRSLDQHYASLARSVEDLTQRELAWAPDPKAMSIGFLVWHYGRTLDRWIHTRALEAIQLWEQGWASQFDRLPPDPNDTGYQFTVEQLRAFKTPPVSVLMGYVSAAKTKAMDFLEQLDDDALERVMINNPRGGQINLATMFQQLLWEFNQHGGQIAYLRGLQRGLEEPGYSGGMLEAEARNAP